ncbi:bifunctional 3-demethylubiquinone-9 3-methyltransferase/ 2-octaprenyl-6-hydroxy phenol methylase [Pedobacter glucosidilyticus]|nr:class I SAM-dependent methyltransferase [Pedobacter glucosidilyticus]KHJ37507.1 bifunctional 3-demethylubiquinone-9 3-methyltransferase/ 2-octaprenyl-6-hydroxy phenol methylase [Pedobacter glucosidilyticus]
MESFIDYTLAYIKEENPIHYKKALKNINELKKDDFFERATTFLDKYDLLLKNKGKNRKYAIDCYLKLLADYTHEGLIFRETGKYSSTSFEEVNKRVYANPEIMQYYMHGLLVSQFLWKHHYVLLKYYIENLAHYATAKSYLEIGGGHGLYVNEAINSFSEDTTFDVVDISESSINMAKHFVDNERVNFIHTDIFDFHPKVQYDFITMGEVLEHVEEPVKLLLKVKALLKPSGTLFLTTPTNAPAIDHLYLFRNYQDILAVVQQAGFCVENEIKVYAENVSEEIAAEFKITMMFGGFLKPQSAT